ncbi:hypothetical protein WJX74_004670 [Apatococcus lobatus]|uniref:Uncharacterized protein n=1 Tax=Apatococcus lobatus TaxID=904363 RepID=A0AAW1QW35_9CHLO
MPFLKLWSSGDREYQKLLVEEPPESPGGASDCSCNSTWTVQSQQAGSNRSTSTCAPSKFADSQPRSVPAGLSLIDPVRFGAASQPSEALLRLAVTFAEKQRVHASGKLEHERLEKLLSWHDWRLLLWSEENLIKLAAGPESLDKAASNTELRNLMEQRQHAWICAHRIVKQWQRFRLDGARLEIAFTKLWPEWEPLNHQELLGEPCPECPNLKAYVKAFAMTQLQGTSACGNNYPAFLKAGSV